MLGLLSAVGGLWAADVGSAAVADSFRGRGAGERKIQNFTVKPDEWEIHFTT